MAPTRATWRKSSHSGTQSDCVELAWKPNTIAIRDSKNTRGPALYFPHPALGLLVKALDAIIR
jgi:Domain of unknown function (DUF397)